MRGWWRIQRALEALRGEDERTPEPDGREPVRSWGGWDEFDGDVLVLCHPDWRGVRAAAYSHGEPVVEVADAARWAPEIVRRAIDAGVRMLVLHGFPPGASELVELAHDRGISTAAVLHSSTAQHGGEPTEAAVADRVFRLARTGDLDQVGFVKHGTADVFRKLGIDAHWVPNRAPTLPEGPALELGQDVRHVGVFAEPIFRKNVVTQLAAVALMHGSRAHVLVRPTNDYLDGVDIVEHGVLPWEEFVQLQGSVDLNLYVSLSECDPLSPVESYLAGVPCLMSRTSRLFRSDPELWEVTTIAELDDPSLIAEAASSLLGHRDEAVRRAQSWIRDADADAAARWNSFTRR